jgi:hypothetical protein
MIDIKTVEAEARAELNADAAKAAKTKIKASLQTIARAEAVLQNARDEHAVLLRTIGADAI